MPNINPHARRWLATLVCLVAPLLIFGCSSSGSATAKAPDSITLSLAESTGSVSPGGTTAAVAAEVSRSSGNENSVSLSASGEPAGVSASFVQPLSGSTGSVTFSSAASTAPGAYPIVVTAFDGIATAAATFTLTVQATDSISITPANASVLAPQDGAAVSDSFSITRSYGNTNAVTVSTSGLPTGLTASLTQPGSGSSGSVTFTTSATPPVAGSYNVTLTASDGTASSTCMVTVVVAVVATIENSVDTNEGISGHLMEFMSTGFQPSDYDNSFFVSFPSTANLANLDSEHIRLQTVADTIPWKADSSPEQPTDWSFTAMDQTVQPVLGVGDNSPVFQIAVAPSFLCDSSGHFVFNTPNLQLFAEYAQNLVRYYNTGGFDWGGQHFQSASSHPITWWAIFNEPNLNGLTAAQYVQLYNTVVPAMLSVDPSLKFVGLELSDYSGQPQLYLPQLVKPAASGGVSAQIDAISTHFYGSCNEKTTDAAMFAAVSQFASDVKYFRTELATRSDLENVPVWVTENNVDADYQTSSGYSNCNPGQLFVTDQRGTSAFFTAWRPYVFSQLGKAGNEALYHFLFEGSSQYGEVSNTTAATTLAYWTDYWLERVFPWDGSSTGSTILESSTTESTPSVEVLAVQNADNSVSLLVSNLAVASASDDNGTGAPRTVLVDISALGSFSSGTEIDLNASTSPATGPVSEPLTPGTKLTLTFTGYGSTMFMLQR